VLSTLARKESELRAKNGSWYSMRMMPYRTLENVIDGVVITFVDISHLKEIKQLERLATVVRDSNDAVTVQDFDGKIMAWNKGAELMYGWSEAEALAMNIREMVPEDRRKGVDEFTKELKKGRVMKSFAAQRLCKNGKILDVWLTVTVLRDTAGRPAEIATTERDMSEFKQLRKDWVKR